jgi:predicted ATPase
MLLKKVEIRNFRLSGKDVIWEILPDASILVGKNGTSKTTLLRMIAAALRKDKKETDIDLFLQNEYIRRKDKKETDIDLFLQNEYIRLYFDNENIIEIDGNGEDFSLYEKDFRIESEFIETFDVPNKEGKSILDELLAQLTNDFLLFQSRLRKDIDALYTKKHKFSAEQIANIEKNIQINNERRERFEETVNFFFKDSDKVLQIEDDFSFLCENEISLPISALSSGEKQLLVILLKVFLQNEEPYLLLLDEPEISMHTYWQRELLSKIRFINPNCQLLVVTHSGTLLGRGWMQNFVRIEEITAPYNTKNIQETPSLEYDEEKMKKLREEIEKIQGSMIDNWIQFKAIISDLKTLSYKEFTELIKLAESSNVIYYDDIVKTCILKMPWEEAEKLLDVEKDAYFHKDTRLSLKGYLVWIIKNAASFNLAFEKLAHLDYLIRSYNLIIVLSVVFNKTTNKEECLRLERFRHLLNIEPNPLYLKKLAFKNIPLMP